MGDASYNQPSFLGGEWSPNAQGRIDEKKYRTAMNVCLNTIPMEEGAGTRRPGFAFICTTRNGAKGRVIDFDFTDVAPFTIELTDSHIRVIEGRSLVFDTVQTVTDVSLDNPAVVTVPSTAAWASNDQVQFLFQSAATVSTGAILRNRQLKVTILNANQFTMADPITGTAVNGADVAWDPAQVQAQVARVCDISSPFTAAELNAVRRVQAAGVGINNASVAILLHVNHQPRALTASLNATAVNFSTFTLGTLAFVDGPYLDPPSGATLTPSGTANGFTVQIGYGTWSSTTAYNIGDFTSFGGGAYQSLTESNVNNQPDTHPANWQLVSAGAAVGPKGFQSGDVGRLIRLLSEPAAWAAGTNFAIGDATKYNGAYYIAQVANSGAEPDINLVDWLPTTAITVAQWVWGQISAVNSTSNATVTLMGPQQTLLYNLPILSWRVGVYADSVGWPTCGAYYEGRLWIGGQTVPNRFDASMSNDPFNFSPTDVDGTIGDGNAISEVFNSDDQNTLYWMEPTASGLLCGTKKGEWLIQASNLKDPITPTSIQVDRVTKVGCFNQIPVHTPLTMVIIQRFSRLLFEVFPDLYSGKITAPNLNVYSKHLTAAGVAELAYQSELAPLLWARNADGTLVGWTYRRVTAHSASEPEIVGGHRHTLGNGRTLGSICVNSTPSQTSDALMATTVDPITGVYHVEQMTRMLDPTDTQLAAWFVDDAVTPSGIVAGTTSVTFYGLWHLNGKTVSAVCGGLDLGDYLVTNGSITVPYKSDPGKAFTLAYIQSLDANTYGDLAVSLETTVTVAPGTTAQPAVINQLILPQTNVTGAASNVGAMDFPNNRVYILGDNGIRKVSLTNFTEVDEATFSAINATFGGGWQLDTAYAFTYGTDGFLYFRALHGGAFNQSPWVKVNATTYAIVASFGSNSNFWSGGPTGLGAPSVMMQMFGGQNYLAAGVQQSAFGYAIAWMNADSFTFIPEHGTAVEFSIEGGFGIIGCNGNAGPLGATAYFLSTPLGGTNPNPAHVTLYTSTIDAVGTAATTTVTKTINATDIDPAWTGITSVQIARDQRDGNLLLAVAGNGGTNGQYVVKMTTDGTILWKTVVGALPSAMALSRAAHGVLSYIGEGTGVGTNRFVYVFNTVNGTFVKYTISQTVPFGLSISDDATGTMLVYVQYGNDGSTLTPQPGPNTNSAFTGWAVLTLGDVLRGASSSTDRDTIPAVVGFTYTSRGQIVRPAQQGETGSQTGPGEGKTRRNHMASFLFSAAVYGSVYIGTVFGKLRPANFKQADATTPVPTTGLFTGVYWSTIEDNYSFDGMIAWEITRPLPCTVVSITGFLHTQDR